MAGSVRREEEVPPSMLGLVFKVSFRSDTVSFRSFSSYMRYLSFKSSRLYRRLIYINYVVVYYIFGFKDILTHKNICPVYNVHKDFREIKTHII